MRMIRSLSLAVLAVAAGASAAFAQIVSITVAPPVLPVYEQPPIPAAGYIWTPGYWAYGDDGYFWVPGTWIQPPSVGLLWTPGYWGWNNGVYVWNAGYWGSHVGFYGGVNYGFGYVGTGYAGGVWRGGVFSYNRTVNNFGGVSISNTYNKTVINNTSATRVSFNGGTGGIAARPTPQEMAAAKETHVAATAVQTQHQQAAGANKELHASFNHGNPSVAATSSPGQFSGHGVVGAKAAVGAGPNAKGANVNAGRAAATGNRGPTGSQGSNGPANAAGHNAAIAPRGSTSNSFQSNAAAHNGSPPNGAAHNGSPPNGAGHTPPRQVSTAAAKRAPPPHPADNHR